MNYRRLSKRKGKARSTVVERETMTEPRTSRRVARIALLLLILGLVVVVLPRGPAMWEWAVYGEWKPIKGWGIAFSPGPPRVVYQLPGKLRRIVKDLRAAQPMGSDACSYFKAKQKRLHWVPGKDDLIILQIGKEEFQGMFPNASSQILLQVYHLFMY